MHLSDQDPSIPLPLEDKMIELSKHPAQSKATDSVQHASKANCNKPSSETFKAEILSGSALL
jgi:hypothetical protein